jgi:hypothetical protein
MVVEGTAPEDVVHDQDPRRGNTLRDRQEPRYRAVALDRDGHFFDAHVGDGRAGGDLGVTHLGDLLAVDGIGATIARENRPSRISRAQALGPARP